MSDCARNRFNEEEDFQVVLGKGNPGESSCQQHTKWMAHWTRASSSPYGKSCSPLEDANNSNCTKNSETSPFELRKFTVAERLMLGRNHEGISMKNVPRLDPNMWGVAHDAWQEAEQTKIEWRDGHFQSCKIQMQKDENFYAKRVVSETLSVCRLSDLPLNFQKLVSSEENPDDSHCNQIPMLSFNQKVESIVSPKRKYATGTVFDDLFVPQQIPKLNVAPSRMTDMVMDRCKPSGSIKHPLEDPTCLVSDHSGKKLKVDNNSSSDCRIDEQDTVHYFANPNQEPPSRCGEKQFNLSENSDKGQTVGGAPQNHKSRTPTRLRKHEVAAGVMLSTPVLGKEYETKAINYFMNSKQDDEDFYVASHLISDKHHDLNTHRMEYAANVTDSCMFPDPAASILATNSKGGAVTRERQPVDRFTDSVEQNGPCLFEMLTIPSKSQSTYPIDLLSSCSPLFGAQNQFSPKAKTMHGDSQHVSKSSAGTDSSLMQKDNGCAERANEQLATLSIEGSPRYNKENIFRKVNANHSTPETEIMDLDPPLFQSSTRNQVPNDTDRLSAGADPSDKWLKRLLHNTTDPHVHRSKRPRTGDYRPVGGAGGMSGTYIADHVEARRVRCWIGRLCRGGVAPVSHGGPGQGTREAAEPDVAARELGGHFPSIKAMAMIGRMMSKVRPFDYERKGPCVMWKAEEGA
ncbi:hypothetical protein CFC21_003860 [Triticum aestivum]|uniref:Uncharacterized protein n=2 Tax=Triticum TaxID=4564 RepID=A0A9R0V028_TRITD|nr:uncharacterized protein LOC123066712 isoform X1 [Triticum aestivum]XP_044345691.1 uncharacterized protein LOC123066712 isoform X1 [Triticum aestivum]KAF6986069.1 hypothetical protein CFC21_003860 [Triticum aestivum]VAH10957.1 unnamed protein product [Triticum turgidum subsp. durum]